MFEILTDKNNTYLETFFSINQNDMKTIEYQSRLC